MRKIEKTVYTFDELSDKAKSRAREWLLDDTIRAQLFEDDVNEELKYLFPKSNLHVEFSLGYCQGDGLNTCGEFDFSDMLTVSQRASHVSDPLCNFTDKEKARLTFYIPYVGKYTFESNTHYCYSCKFIDMKYMEHTAHEWIESLKYDCIRDIDFNLIRRFLHVSFEWMEAYDRETEKAGYEYLYPDDETLSEECIINGYEFFENGECAF